MLQPDAHPFLRPACLLAALLLASSLAQAAPAVQIQRDDVRLFGYQLGDVVTESVDIQLAPGYVLDASSLPKAGKRAGWFTLRAIRQQDHPLTNGGTRVHLDIEVQLVNAPKQAQTVNVPPIALRFKGATTVTETIASLAVDVVPLGTGELRADLPELRPLRAAPLINLDEANRQLQWTGVAAATGLLWLLLTLTVRALKPRARRPFAQAARELRPLLRASQSLEGARQAVQRVHRAFDQAAGHRLFTEGVSAYTDRVGADAKLQAQTRDFFQLSRQLFFAPETAGAPADVATQLRTLVKAWQHFERRHP